MHNLIMPPQKLRNLRSAPDRPKLRHAENRSSFSAEMMLSMLLLRAFVHPRSFGMGGKTARELARDRPVFETSPKKLGETVKPVVSIVVL